MKTINAYYFFVLIMLLLFCSSTNAQKTLVAETFCNKEIVNKLKKENTQNIDEIISWLEKKTTEVDQKCKVELYRIIAEYYEIQSNNDKVILNLRKGLALAVKINYSQECSQIHFKLCDYYEQKNAFAQAKLHIDSSVFYIKKYTDLNDEVGYLSRTSNWYINVNKIDSAILFLNLAIVAETKQKDTNNLHVDLHNLGSLYINQGEYNLAIDNLLKSLYYKDLVKDIYNTPGTLLLLGNAYLELKQFKTANDYFYKAKNICIKTNNVETLYFCYFLLTKNAINDTANFKKGIIYADSTVFFALQSKSESKIIDAKSVKANFMLVSNYKTEEAEILSLNILKECERLDKKSKICDITYSLGKFYYKVARYNEAEKYLSYSLEIGKKVSKSHLLISIYKLLSKIYEQKGDFKTALLYHQQFYALQDSLENGKLKSNLAEFEKKYNIGKKEVEIANLNNEKELKNADLKQAHTRQRFFIIVSLLLIGFLFTGLWAYKKLRTSKNSLAQKNTELDNLNQVKNRLFSIIAHDVKGLAIPFQRASRILNHHIQKQNFEKTLEVAQQLETNAESLSNLLDNLLQWSLEQMNGYTPKPEMLVLKNEMVQIMETYEGHANYKNTILSENISDSLLLETDKGAFHVIFRNVIANAIKYTENGTIKINAEKEKENIICTVKDSGNGISANIIKKLFSIESDKIKNGTAGEKGSGLGLVLVKKFLDLNGGTIKVNSVEGEGTSFIISFPYKQAS